MAVTGVHFILFTDWSHWLESDFTDFTWSSDIYSLEWNSGASGEATWWNWFNVLTNVTVFDISVGENNTFIFAKSFLNYLQENSTCVYRWF